MQQDTGAQATTRRCPTLPALELPPPLVAVVVVVIIVMVVAAAGVAISV